jgi:hypothetical protein
MRIFLKTSILILAVALLQPEFDGTAVIYAQNADTTNTSVDSLLDQAPAPSSRSRRGSKAKKKKKKGGWWPFGKSKRKPKAGPDQTRQVQETRTIEKLTQEELNYEFLLSARRGNIRLMRDLLEEGALINSRDRQGRTALIEAARTGKLEVCQILIEYGASVNLRDMYDGTALLYSSKAGYQEIINLLLKNGARNEQL